MSSKYGSSSGDGGDAFKNTTPASMSQKLNEPKKKRKDSHKKEEHTLRRRTQNRNSQRAYRERREQRLLELESEVQQAEALNQTLTSAYQDLRAEFDRLQEEKAQEQYNAEIASQVALYDPSYATSTSTAGGYEEGNITCGDITWPLQEWENEDGYSHQ